ncbi:MAG: M16 family metallopeptidase, partial [Bacteroidota bacterium]
MTLDRSTPPATAPLTYRPLPAVAQHHLKNDLPVYTIQHGPMAVVEIAFHFYAGTVQAGKAGISGLVAKMLSEGTRHHTAEQLATKLDDHGAEIEAKGERSLLTVALSAPTEALGEVLPLLAEVLFESEFPQPAYSLLINRMSESLKVNSQRTKYHAQRAFLHKVFGPDHPLGMHLGPEELKAVGINDLRGHYREFLTMNNAFVTVAGQFDEDDTLKQLQHFFGGTHLLTDPPKPRPTQAMTTAEAGRYDIALPDKLQSTLRL